MIKYSDLKQGLFSVDTNVYDPVKGWILQPELNTIIGEDDHIYITRSYISEIDYWDRDGVRFTEVKQTNIGIHKSRLISWLTIPQVAYCPVNFVQLQLFD